MLAAARAGLRAGRGRAASARWPSLAARSLAWDCEHLQRASYLRALLWRGGWLRHAVFLANQPDRASRTTCMLWRSPTSTIGGRTTKAQCSSVGMPSALRPASSKEGYPTGKRSLCSSSRARSVPARVEVNRQNPCPKMQKLWKLVPLSRVERATRAHIARQERATTLRRALLQPLRCPGKNQGCVQHKHPQAIAAPGSRHRPGRRDTSA